MKRLPMVIDKGLTTFSYALIAFCFYLLLFTRFSGMTAIEGYLLAIYSLFVRDLYNLYYKRKALNTYGFEDELFR
jgi:hypothetical protein